METNASERQGEASFPPLLTCHACSPPKADARSASCTYNAKKEIVTFKLQQPEKNSSPSPESHQYYYHERVCAFVILHLSTVIYDTEDKEGRQARRSVLANTGRGDDDDGKRTYMLFLWEGEELVKGPDHTQQENRCCPVTVLCTSTIHWATELCHCLEWS